MAQPANFNDVIHRTDYLSQYRQTMIGRDSIVTEGDRPGGWREPLDGEWSFSIDQYDSFLRARWFQEARSDQPERHRPPDYDFEAWEKAVVPSCWNMQNDRYHYYEGSAIYTRTFGYSAKREGERVFLKVGAANYESFVFLNKRYVATHSGGSTPFFVEVTGLLESDNRLAVVVNNRREADRVPAENTDWFNFGGVYRSVELLRFPRAFIRRFSVALVPGSNFSQIRVSVEVVDAPARGETGAHGEGAAVPAVSRPAVTVRIGGLGVDEQVQLSEGSGSLVIAASPELWTPESPKLYDVELSYGDLDAVSDRIGFREISVSGLSVLLNGKPIYLKGVSCHEDSLQNGKAITSEDIETMLDHASELGCNFIRLAHYPHTELASRIADERGMFLWEEIPVYWAIDFGNERTYADAENQLRELVLRDVNRASVILWSVGNENLDSDDRLSFMRRLADTARRLDPTRPVTAACLWDRTTNTIEDRLAEHLDVIGLNEYFGWYEGDLQVLLDLFHKSVPEKPVIVSEFGAGAFPGHHGTDDELFTEEMQKRIYEEQISVIRNAPYVVGMTPWILYDFRSPRRLNSFQRGFNLKGLISADRKRKKQAFAVLREFYRSQPSTPPSVSNKKGSKRPPS